MWPVRELGVSGSGRPGRRLDHCSSTKHEPRAGIFVVFQVGSLLPLASGAHIHMKEWEALGQRCYPAPASRDPIISLCWVEDVEGYCV